MGCGASANTTKTMPHKDIDIGKENPDKTPKIQDQVNSIEKFARDSYLAGPKIEALKNILSQSSSRSAFMQFLRSEYSKEHMQFFLDVEAVRQSDPKDLAVTAERIVSNYIKPDHEAKVSATDRINNNINKLKEMDEVDDETVSSALTRAQADTVVVMALGAFPRFLQSQYYDKWREQEQHLHNAAVEMRKAEIIRGNIIVDENTSIAEKALMSVSQSEVEKLLIGKSWLTSLFSAVENLPICVSVANADKKYPGFPLIYVNACFERTTGYARSEIIGRNCKFLQKDLSEHDSIARLSAALKDALPVKVAITNFRKNGAPFKNLLALKPLFDENKQYRYVVGVQFDISGDDATAATLRLADDLINMIPTTVFVEPDEA